MQALSQAGLADSGGDDLESASPTTPLVDKSTCYRELPLCYPDIVSEIACFSESSARKSTPPYGGVLSLTNLVSKSSSSGPGSRSTRSRPDRPGPLNGGRAVRVVCSRPAGLCGTGGLGRKQAPSHGGLTRPASLLAASGPVYRAGPSRGRCAVGWWSQ